MSYVTDSLGWSERVRMENGAQNKFAFPLIPNRFLERF